VASDGAGMTTSLDSTDAVLYHLRDAQAALSRAHGAAGEHEGARIDLIGPVRDLIFGLNTAVGALMAMVEGDTT
jgi:hypothetical protein